MSEKEIAFWALIVTLLGLIAAFVGIVFAFRTLNVAIQTVQESQRVARANFFVSVRALLANYDDIHANLGHAGKWTVKDSIGPENRSEWERLTLYMETFEYCETLINEGLLDEEEFRKAYTYRLRKIATHPIMSQKKLVTNAPLWGDFFKLCDRCGIGLPPESQLR